MCIPGVWLIEGKEMEINIITIVTNLLVPLIGFMLLLYQLQLREGKKILEWMEEKRKNVFTFKEAIEQENERIKKTLEGTPKEYIYKIIGKYEKRIIKLNKNIEEEIEEMPLSLTFIIKETPKIKGLKEKLIENISNYRLLCVKEITEKITKKEISNGLEITKEYFKEIKDLTYSSNKIEYSRLIEKLKKELRKPFPKNKWIIKRKI